MPGHDELQLVRDLYSQGLLEAQSAQDGGLDVTVDVSRLSQTAKRELRRRRMLVDVADRAKLSDYAAGVFQYVMAEQAITKVWQAEGGPMGPVGLPIGDRITVATAGEDGFQAPFRSGTITFSNNEVISKTERVLVVDFVGMECHVRQEKTDELYGVVGVVGAANRAVSTYAFPGGNNTIDMGPDGQRIWNTFYRLYEGPVEDITLVGSLIEHDDFSDIEGTSRQIADKIAQTAGQLVGGLTGAPAEAVADNTWFRDGLAAGIGVILGGVFGMGDDPYPASALHLAWEELGQWGPPQQPARTRGDDPKRIEHWTHALKMAGQDDGGDYGDYDLYFNIFIEERSDTRHHPNP